MLVSMHTDFSTLIFFLFLLVRNAWSLGIEFTAPQGGSTWPAGPLTVTWSDAGGSPSMADLTTYTLQLMVGGNNPDNSKALVTIGNPGDLVAAGSVSGLVPASSAQSIQNGFYLMMTSNTSDGNQVINYSDRFTLINMNGTTDDHILTAANADAGAVSNVPEAQYNVIAKPTSPTAPGTASASGTHAATPTDTASHPDHPKGSPNDGMSDVSIGLIVMGSILAIIGAISIVVWILFFYRRIRKKRQEAKIWNTRKDEDVEQFGLGSKTELAAYRSSRAVGSSGSPTEMNAEQDAREVPGSNKAVEVPGSPMIFELEGDMSAWEAGSGRRSKAWDPI